MFNLNPAHVALVGQGCAGLLSFHCWEREVVAALWSQPNAVPSTLGATQLEPSLEPLSPAPNLERASQLIAPYIAQLNEPDQCPITIMSPLGLQARATELDNTIVLSKSLLSCHDNNALSMWDDKQLKLIYLCFSRS